MGPFTPRQRRHSSFTDRCITTPCRLSLLRPSNPKLHPNRLNATHPTTDDLREADQLAPSPPFPTSTYWMYCFAQLAENNPPSPSCVLRSPEKQTNEHADSKTTSSLQQQTQARARSLCLGCPKATSRLRQFCHPSCHDTACSFAPNKRT